MQRYDWIIIGAGPAGYEAAAIAAGRGERVLLVERSELGGTCLNRGCIPTKTFCRSAQVAADAASAGEFGICLGAEGFTVDMPAIVERKNRVVGQLREMVAMVTTKAEVIKGNARFAGPKTISVATADGEITAEAERILIATGSEAARLPIPGIEMTVSSTELLDLGQLPESLAVIGGGVIGMEFASIFAALGVKVTVIEYCKEVLPPFDKDISKRLRTAMQRRGVEFVTGAEVNAVSVSAAGSKCVAYTAKGKPGEVEAEIVLCAVGRRPVLPEGAAEAGIAIGRRGIEVNDSFETSAPGVYAVGDCNGRCLLAHAASAQARKVMGEEVNLDVIPSAVFTMPECAMVGMTEAQCKDAGIEIKVGKGLFRGNGKALAMGEGDGIVKIITGQATGRMLGCHICGPHAADLIAEAALLMATGLPVAALASTIYAHPTLSEALLTAL